MLELRYQLARDGGSPFEEWFAGLDAPAAAKVAVALARLEQGNLSNAKGVGEGVLEYRIDWGPGDLRVFRARRRRAGDGRDQATAATRYRDGQEQPDRLQAATAAPEMTEADMALTKSFKELV